MTLFHKITVIVIVLFLTFKVNALTEINNEHLISTMNEFSKMIIDDDNQYPNYYAGMYLNNEGDKIIFKYVKSLVNKDDKEVINKILSNNNVLGIEAKYSYNYLLSESIDITKNNVRNENYIGSYVDVMNNKIIVEFDENYHNKPFISTKNSSMIIGKEIVINDYTKINYAHKMDNLKTKKGPGSPTSSQCTVGFRTKYAGEYGYVTAGHCVGKLSINDGKVLLSKNEGTSDYAFVRTRDKFVLTNKLIYPGDGVKELEVSNYTPFIYVNTIVGKSGKTTGFTSGKVTTTSYSGIFDGIEFYNLVCANLSSARGDSGSAIFAYNGEYGVLYGILKGGKVDGTSTCFTNIMFVDGDLIRGRY